MFPIRADLLSFSGETGPKPLQAGSGLCVGLEDTLQQASIWFVGGSYLNSTI